MKMRATFLSLLIQFPMKGEKNAQEPTQLPNISTLPDFQAVLSRLFCKKQCLRQVARVEGREERRHALI